jgi:hypothetical protein
VAVKLRKTVTVEADLLALSGVLKVGANVDKARVFVDGEYIGDAPIEQEVDPGTKHVKVRLLGYYDFEASLDVVAGEEYAVNAELERLPPEEDPTIAEAPRQRRWYEQWWVWTIVGAVVVSAAVAIPVAITQQPDYCRHAWPDVDSCDDEKVMTVIAGQTPPPAL